MTGSEHSAGRSRSRGQGNGIRLAVLGIVVGIALTVAFGVQTVWWARVLLGIGTFALTCFLFWWKPVRSVLMEFMHRITGA